MKGRVFMKKLLSILLVVTSIVSLSACSKNNNKSNEAEPTTIALLSDSFEFELASGYDAENNFYQLVANEDESYSGLVVSVAVLKNNELLIEPTSTSPFNNEDGFIEDKESIVYIGNGCFFLDNCIWNTNTDQSVCLPEEDWSLNITLNYNGENETICNNDGFFMFHRSDEWIDANIDAYSVLDYIPEFLLVDTNTTNATVIVCEALTDVPPFYRTHIEFGPYSNGLISMRLYFDEYTPSSIDGFYDIEWNKKIDLYEYSTTSDNIGFKNDKAVFEIKNNAGTPYMITMDKTGTVIESVEIVEEEE